MRAIFCADFANDCRPCDLERLFRRYGTVDRVDMRSGHALIYMEDECEAEVAIRELDQIQFGHKGFKLRVRWTKYECGITRSERSRKSSNLRPSRTLFVINFDPYHTTTRDLERHFDPYGKVLSVRIRKNFAFIQYESQEDATKALKATKMSKLLNRFIDVEYAMKYDDERQNGYNPIQTYYGGWRSTSPCRRERDRSPSPCRGEQANPDYGCWSSRSPRDESNPNSQSEKPTRDNVSCSDAGEIASPDYGNEAGGSPEREQRKIISPDDNGHSSSPNPKPEGMDSRVHSDQESPLHSNNVACPGAGERTRPDYGHGPNRSPQREQLKSIGPDDNGHSRSPNHKPKVMDNRANIDQESPLPSNTSDSVDHLQHVEDLILD